MTEGCEECQLCRSAISVFQCGLEASVRRAAQVNSSEAWGKVASLKTHLRHIEELWARHCRNAHALQPDLNATQQTDPVAL
jgi:hypothetical protein